MPRRKWKDDTGHTSALFVSDKCVTSAQLITATVLQAYGSQFSHRLANCHLVASNASGFPNHVFMRLEQKSNHTGSMMTMRINTFKLKVPYISDVTYVFTCPTKTVLWTTGAKPSKEIGNHDCEAWNRTNSKRQKSVSKKQGRQMYDHSNNLP